MSKRKDVPAAVPGSGTESKKLKTDSEPGVDDFPLRTTTAVRNKALKDGRSVETILKITGIYKEDVDKVTNLNSVLYRHWWDSKVEEFESMEATEKKRNTNNITARVSKWKSNAIPDCQWCIDELTELGKNLNDAKLQAKVNSAKKDLADLIDRVKETQNPDSEIMDIDKALKVLKGGFENTKLRAGEVNSTSRCKQARYRYRTNYKKLEPVLVAALFDEEISKDINLMNKIKEHRDIFHNLQPQTDKSRGLGVHTGTSEVEVEVEGGTDPDFDVGKYITEELGLQPGQTVKDYEYKPGDGDR